MIEHVFRGKCTNPGELYGKWVEGDLIVIKGDPYIHPACNSSKLDRELIKMIIGHRVDPNTVVKNTGIVDKNGELIFEGDFVVCKQDLVGNFIDSHIEIGYVEMKHGAFGLHRKQGYYRPFKDWLEDYEYEVIGNIYDNPELLEAANV